MKDFKHHILKCLVNHNEYITVTGDANHKKVEPMNMIMGIYLCSDFSENLVVLNNEKFILLFLMLLPSFIILLKSLKPQDQVWKMFNPMNCGYTAAITLLIHLSMLDPRTSILRYVCTR